MSGETAVDACERAIRRRILDRTFRPGERLPPERTLADELGVNRTTLRAALTRLASARLLTVRQGSGYVVQDYTREAGLELLPALEEIMDAPDRAEMVRDLLAVRRRLAVLVFERVAARVTEADIRAIERAVQRFSEVVASGADRDAIADADLDVTAALLAATGSPVLQLCFNPVSFVVHALEPLRVQMYAEPGTNVAAYRLLVGWLRQPSLEAIALLEAELARRDESAVARMREE